MTTPPHTLTTGPADAALEQRLTEELIAFNNTATGNAERTEFTVRVTGDEGDLVAGLVAWTWGALAGIDLVWVRADSREAGWGSRLVQAAEAEARRRGCDRISVSSFTFQAPGFYRRHGFVETGRTLGIPGGHEDVHLFKRLAE
ncbi:GNAT family N-acetyltransferase [Crossiella sp. CA198]|uniref:GNAT family N-acetyltransferase n=1 Tax=Crossiella sp. CA198 TaxID=3455607 RepID=UPI003F8D5507